MRFHLLVLLRQQQVKQHSCCDEGSTPVDLFILEFGLTSIFAISKRHQSSYKPGSLLCEIQPRE